MVPCTWQVVGDCWLGILLGSSAQGLHSPPYELLHIDIYASSHHGRVTIVKLTIKSTAVKLPGLLKARGLEPALSHFPCTLWVKADHRPFLDSQGGTYART